MSLLRIGLAIFASLALAAYAGASEIDDLREKARAMQREAAELAERGNTEEAENLERKSIGMIEEATHLEHRHANHRDAEIMEMEERLEMLRMKVRKLEALDGNDDRLVDARQEAERIERELREYSRAPNRERAGSHVEVARRLEHMRIAVEHLHHAGLHDVAERVTQRVEATERELHEQRRHHDDDPIHGIMKQLDEIRHEVGRLRDEMNDLRNEH